MQKLLNLANGALFVHKSGQVTYISNDQLSKTVINGHGVRVPDHQNQRLQALNAIDSFIIDEKAIAKDVTDKVMEFVTHLAVQEDEAPTPVKRTPAKKKAATKKQEELIQDSDVE